MSTIFNRQNENEFIDRILSLSHSSKPIWGKSNVFQMVKYCILSEHMYLGKTRNKRLFIGRIFGSFALKSMLKNSKQLNKNQPTHPIFKITENGDLEPQKKIWINQIKEYNKPKVDFSDFSHPFFGKMNKVQMGQAIYKHIDHHLRQFGV